MSKARKKRKPPQRPIIYVDINSAEYHRTLRKIGEWADSYRKAARELLASFDR